MIDPNSVAPELREHVQQFNALSTQNPYQGVVVNPASCLIVDIRNDLQSFPIVMDVKFGTDPQWTDYRPEFQQDIDTINSDCDIIQDHTDRLTSNLPSLAGIAQASLALATVMSLLSNPCLGLDGMLGSIMDSGKALLNDVKKQIASALQKAKEAVSAALGPLIADIKGAIAGAKAKIAAFVAKAKAEVMNFAKSLLAQARQGLAELMANLPKDPCLRSLMKSAATGAAAGIIGG